MKRFTKRLIVILCVFALTVSALFGGCAKSGSTGIKKYSYQGTHVYTATDTEHYFVKDGKTDYKLVIPAALSANLKMAKDEFIYLLKTATGATISAVVDTGLTYTDNAQYISLGDNEYYQSSGLDIDTSNLKIDGVRIVTQGKSVFLLGPTDEGVLNAVYTFMQVTFNYDCYYRDCIEIDNVSDMKLKNYDVTDVPDIEARVYNTSVLKNTDFSEYDARMYGYRMKIDFGIGEAFMPVFTGEDCTGSQKGFHNTLYYVPREQYGDRPWYSTRGDQLCYTARGDKEQYEDLVEACSEKVIDSLIKYNPVDYPQKNVMTMSMEDNAATCSCASCTAVKNEYGAESAAVILFVNDMCEYVENWMEQPENAAYKRDDFNIMFFAYHNFEACPATKNSNGKYVLNNGLTMHPMASVWVALAFAYTSDFYSSANDVAREKMQAWTDVCQNIRLWTYSFNFTAKDCFYDLFNFYTSEFYQYIAARGASYLFNEGNDSEDGTASTFQTLSAYLNSKLMWDSSLNSYELIEKYFNAMYKDAAPAMMQIFQEMRIYALKVSRGEGGSAGGSVMGDDVGWPKYWPEGILRTWIKKLDAAILDIEKYKEIDMETYETLKKHIEIEYISPAVQILRYYGSTLNVSEYNEYRDRLIDIQSWAKSPRLADHLVSFS